MKLFWTALLASLTVAGCGNGDAGDEDAGGPIPFDAGDIAPEAVIGTGEIEFEEITDGQDLQFIRGPQGGFHFLGSVRIQGVNPGNPDDRRDPSNPTTTFVVTRDGTRIDMPDATTYVQGLDPALGVPDAFEMIGRLVILDITTCADLDGDTVDMEVTVTAADGTSVTDRRTVVAIPHPLNMGGGF